MLVGGHEIRRPAVRSGDADRPPAEAPRFYPRLDPAPAEAPAHPCPIPGVSGCGGSRRSSLAVCRGGAPVENDDVIQAFAPHGTDQPFHIRGLPGRVGRDAEFLQTQGLGAVLELLPVNAVAVTKQVLWGRSKGEASRSCWAVQAADGHSTRLKWSTWRRWWDRTGKT